VFRHHWAVTERAHDYQQAVVELLDARKGHFALESGHHGELWLDLDALFVQPSPIVRFADELARRLASAGVEAVCGPLVGGALLAQAVATHLDVEFLYAERRASEPGARLYAVRYRLPAAMRTVAAGRAVAIVDDVVNAGSATRATYAELRDAGARPAAIATLLTLGTAVPEFAREHSLQLASLAALPNSLWEPAICPLCAAGTPLDEV
jgi:orotate phosphoribosyltransferase